VKCVQYKNLGNDQNRIDFNNAFHEVRTLKENSYHRVGIWFPLLGNNKRKLPYKDETLVAAIQAAVRLHNFIMNTAHLSYSAADSAEMHFSIFFKKKIYLISFPFMISISYYFQRILSFIK
jgi:hypothetical protein